MFENSFILLHIVSEFIQKVIIVNLAISFFQFFHDFQLLKSSHHITYFCVVTYGRKYFDLVYTISKCCRVLLVSASVSFFAVDVLLFANLWYMINVHQLYLSLLDDGRLLLVMI